MESGGACASRAAQHHYLLGGISHPSRLPPLYISATDRRMLTSSSHIHRASNSSFVKPSLISMSDKCGNCDCADKSQCVKKGDSYGVVIVDAEKSHFEVVEEVACENDGKCKCTTSCSCAGCNCGK